MYTWNKIWMTGIHWPTQSPILGRMENYYRPVRPRRSGIHTLDIVVVQVGHVMVAFDATITKYLATKYVLTFHSCCSVLWGKGDENARPENDGQKLVDWRLSK